MARATDLYRESLVKLMERVRHPPVGEQPSRQLHAEGADRPPVVYQKRFRDARAKNQEAGMWAGGKSACPSLLGCL